MKKTYQLQCFGYSFCIHNSTIVSYKKRKKVLLSNLRVLLNYTYCANFMLVWPNRLKYPVNFNLGPLMCL